MREVGRLAQEVAPVWLAVLVALPWLVPGGSAAPWSPMQPALRGLWYAEHRLAAGDELYLMADPVTGAGFSLSPVGAVLLRPMLLGTLFGWQVLWPLLAAAALQVVLRQLGLPRGLWLGIIGAAVALLLAPMRAAFGEGGAGLLIWALVMVDLLGARDASNRPVSGGARLDLPPGVLTGLAAAMQLGPLLFLVMLLGAGERRIARNGLTVFAVAVAAGCLVLPFDSWQFTNLGWQGLLHPVMQGADPRIVAGLPASAQAVPWLEPVVDVLVLGATIPASAFWWRRGQRMTAVGVLGLGMALAVPPQWSGGGLWALPGLAAALGAHRAFRGRPAGWWHWPMLAWAGWELGAPADLVAWPAWQRVGAALGVLALVGVVLDSPCRFRRKARPNGEMPTLRGEPDRQT